MSAAAAGVTCGHQLSAPHSAACPTSEEVLKTSTRSQEPRPPDLEQVAASSTHHPVLLQLLPHACWTNLLVPGISSAEDTQLPLREPLAEDIAQTWCGCNPSCPSGFVSNASQTPRRKKWLDLGTATPGCERGLVYLAGLGPSGGGESN